MDIVIGAACSVVCYNFCCCCCAGGDRGIPRSIDGVTPEYLTKILRDGGSLGEDVSVTTAEVQKISSEETGMTSSVYFLRLTFDGNTTCPAAIVYKMLNDDFEMRVLFKIADLASTEINFLRQYSARVADGRPAIRIPRPLALQFNERTQDFAIVSEDLRGVGRSGSQLHGTADTIPDAKRAIDALALLHAEYWENYETATRFLKTQNHPKRAFVPIIFKDSWPKAVAWMRERKIAGMDVVTAVGDELISPDLPRDQYMQECQTGPLTVIHGDAHNENFLFPADMREPAIVLDFQLASIGQGAWDIANFCVMSLDSDVLERAEHDLLRYYYDSLANALGGAEKIGMNFDELCRRYVSGVCATLIVEAIGQGTASAEELADEAIMNKREIIFQRIATALNRIPQPSILMSKGGGPAKDVHTTTAP